MTQRENLIRTVRFECPEYISMFFHINPACWHHYDQGVLQDLMEAHPFLFPDFRREEKVIPVYDLNQRSDAPYCDPWNCVWETTDDGITGSVHQHPLDSWSNFRNFKAPDPEHTDGVFPINWQNIHNFANQQRAAGFAVCGGLPHGHTFLRLTDIRGYENLIFDMMDEEPDFPALLQMVEEFNYQVIMKWLDVHPDMMCYPEDLGMQNGPMLSPDNFRKYIKPVYQRLMKPAREQGCIIHMHSDGDIRLIVDDLIDGGVDVINLQDIVNGIDWIANRFAGRVCIDIDIDRQNITSRGTPEQIDALIREEVQKLGRKEGGLMMKYGLYPGVPVENISALMDSMEKYAFYYS